MSGRARAAPVVLCAALALVCLVLAAASLAVRVRTPSDGTVVQVSNTVWSPDRLRVDFVLDAASALEEGDQVEAVDGVPLAMIARGQAAGRAVAGDTHTYTVRRDGRTFQLPVRLGSFPVAAFLGRSWPTLLLLGCLAAVAAYVVRRRPGDPAARDLLLVAGLMTCGMLGWLAGDQVLTLAQHGRPTVVTVPGEVALTLVWGVVLHFVLVFPGSPGWARRPAVLTSAYLAPVVLYLVYGVGTVLVVQDTTEQQARLLQVSLPASTLLPVPVAVLFAVIYRQVPDVATRQRMRWVAASLAFAGVLWLALWTVPSALGRPGPDLAYVALLFVPCPVAVGAAVLRHRLFDITTVVRRSLIVAGTAVAVSVLFAAVTWLLGRPLRDESRLDAIAAAALVALLAPPLTATVRTSVGHLVLGGRHSPDEVVARLGELQDLAGTGGGAEQLQELARVLATTLRLSHVAIDLEGPADERLHAEHGQDRGDGLRLQLRQGSRPVGTVVLDPGPEREPFGPADQRLIDILTVLLGGLGSNLVTSAALQVARESLVLAREEERRHLHHRLHDGLGASLAATGMKAQAARQHLLRHDPERAGALLDDLVTDCTALVGELRGVVLDLRPPALDQLGLADAVRERATGLARAAAGTGRPLDVEVQVSGAAVTTGSLPAAVEVAAFWIAVEATHNVLRHAGASHCRIQLCSDAAGASFVLRVLDDGHGLPDHPRAGGGMLSMSERAAELGGHLTVTRRTTGGTAVQASFPLHASKELR